MSAANTLQTPVKRVICHLDEDPSCLELTKINLEMMDSTLEIRSFQRPSELFEALSKNQCSCILTSYKQIPGTIEQILPEISRSTKAPMIIYSIYDGYELERLVNSHQLRYVQKRSNLEHYKQLLKAIREAINANK